MLYRTIPGLALPASAIILGSGGFGTGERLEHTFATLDAYTAIGGNWIDAARIYGNPPGDVEKAIGAWLRARGCRDKIILATRARIRRFKICTRAGWTAPVSKATFPPAWKRWM